MTSILDMVKLIQDDLGETPADKLRLSVSLWTALKRIAIESSADPLKPLEPTAFFGLRVCEDSRLPDGMFAIEQNGVITQIWNGEHWIKLPQEYSNFFKKVSP